MLEGSFLKMACNCCSLCSKAFEIVQTLLESHKQHHTNIKATETGKCDCLDILKMQLADHLLSQLLLESFHNESPVSIKVEPDLEEEICATGSEQDILSYAHAEFLEIKEGEKQNFIDTEKQERNEQSCDNDGEHTSKSRFQCPLCPKAFKYNQSLKKHHSIEHDPQNPIKCNKCKNIFCKDLRAFHSHQRTHDMSQNINDLVCHKCNKIFETHKQLSHHVYVHREKLLSCDSCGKFFNSKHKLLNHIRRHFGIRSDKPKSDKIVCDKCSTVVPRYNLKRHILTKHLNYRPYKCDVCEKKFAELRHLVEHKNIHLNIKPYSCEFCQKSFRQLTALTSHKIRHTDPERFKCNFCKECFVSTESLNKHKRRQHDPATAEARPFACDYENCSSTFRFRENLMAHRNQAHEAKIVDMRCHLCSFTATKAKNYYQHMRRAHDIRGRTNKKAIAKKNSEEAINIVKKL